VIGDRIARAHSLPERAAERLDRFHRLLTDWNRRIGLTAVIDEEDALFTHYLDSLAALPYLPDGALTVIDIGAGAGFPGVPLLLARPQFQMTLLDALAKRVAFLSHAAREVPFPAECVHARAEDYAREKREFFDVAVSRAVASLPVLLEWALPLVRVGGLCIFWKGPKVKEELEDSMRVAPLVGGGNVRVVGAFVTDSSGLETDQRVDDWTSVGQRAAERAAGHTLVLVDKVEPTTTRFPRKAGMAVKRPLVKA